MVRQLAPSPHGAPIEIYCFSNDTGWSNYEAFQSQISQKFSLDPSMLRVRRYARLLRGVPARGCRVELASKAMWVGPFSAGQRADLAPIRAIRI